MLTYTWKCTLRHILGATEKSQARVMGEDRRPNWYIRYMCQGNGPNCTIIYFRHVQTGRLSITRREAIRHCSSIKRRKIK